MPRFRRSLLPLKQAIPKSDETSFAKSNNLSQQTSINSCNLCSKLIQTDFYHPNNLSSPEILADHTKMHSDQERRINNVSVTSAKQSDPGIIDQDHMDAHDKNHVSMVGKYRKQTIRQITLIYDADQCKWSGSENLRPMVHHDRCTTCCRICKKNVTIVDKACKELKLNEIILHITKHLLNTAFYSCQLCEYSTNLMKNMQQHHFDAHLDIKPITIKSNYFTANYLKHKSMILNTIKNCFGIELINSESELAEFKKSHESATDFRLVLLRKKIGDQKTVECKKCAKSISLQKCRLGKLRFSKHCFIQHMRKHLISKQIIRCLQCDVSKSTIPQMIYHFKKNHSNLMLEQPSSCYVNESAKFDKEIDDMLYECFQSTDNDHVQHQQKKINRYWLELQKIIGTEKRIRCTVCLTCVSVRDNKNNFRFVTVLGHALTHVNNNLPIFTCNLCKESAVSPQHMREHLQNFHSNIDSSSGWRRYYENNTNKFEPEIVDMMEKCYDNQTMISTKKRSKTGNIYFRTKTLLAKTRPNGQIGSLCDELIKESLNEFNRLKCKVCSKEIIAVANRIKRKAMINHAMLHTKLPIFKCNKCAFESMTYDRIRHHLEEEHQTIPKVGHSYFDDRKEFEKEIIAALKKCYELQTT